MAAIKALLDISHICRNYTKLVGKNSIIETLPIKVVSKLNFDSSFIPMDSKALYSKANVLNINSLNKEDIFKLLLSGDKHLFILGISKLKKIEINTDKLLNAKSIDELSLIERRKLLCILEITKRQVNKILQSGNLQGEDIEQFLFKFRKLDLPFWDIDKESQINTTKLVRDLLKANEGIVKIKTQNNPDMSKHFDKTLSDLEVFFSTKEVNIGNIKSIGLRYSRTKFIEDAQKIISTLTKKEAKEFMHSFGFEIVDKDLFKYPVSLEESEIIKIVNSSVRKAVEKFTPNVQRFTSENEVSLPGFSELELLINSIAKTFPEFFTAISKKQHGNHSHTLGLHMLKTVQEIILDSRWHLLSDNDKKITKTATLFHDIAKAEGIMDKVHHLTSAQDLSILLKKLSLSDDDRNRVVSLVRNHHWLEEINQPMQSEQADILAQNIAWEFRGQNDWLIAKMFAKADLKAASDNAYQKFKSALTCPLAEKIEQNIKNINFSLSN
jgi:hypothetical protein